MDSGELISGNGVKSVRPKRRRRLWLLSMLVVLGSISACVLDIPQIPLAVHSQAPDFTLNTLDGKKVRLGDFRGKPVILNFWATWCKPCVEELPALEKLWQAYNEGDVVVLAVNQGESEGIIRDFLADHSVSFPILVDRNQKVNRLYRVRGLPTSYFIDENSKIEHELVGFIQIPGVPEDESLLRYYADGEKSWWR